MKNKIISFIFLTTSFHFCVNKGPIDIEKNPPNYTALKKAADIGLKPLNKEDREKKIRMFNNTAKIFHEKVPCNKRRDLLQVYEKALRDLKLCSTSILRLRSEIESEIKSELDKYPTWTQCHMQKKCDIMKQFEFIIYNSNLPTSDLDLAINTVIKLFGSTITELIEKYRAKYKSKQNDIEAASDHFKSLVCHARRDLIRNSIGDKLLLSDNNNEYERGKNFLLSHEHNRELDSINNDLNHYRDFLEYKKLVEDEIAIARLKACCKSMNKK